WTGGAGGVGGVAGRRAAAGAGGQGGVPGRGRGQGPRPDDVSGPVLRRAGGPRRHQRIGTGRAVSSPDTATTSPRTKTSARAGEQADSGSAARASRIRAHRARAATPAISSTLASRTRP